MPEPPVPDDIESDEGSKSGNNRDRWGDKNLNTLIIEELVYALEESIRDLSMPGTLLFDTAYVVYVPLARYSKLHMTFGFVTQETVNKFHDKLREIVRKNPGMRVRALSKAWSFDLIPLGEGTCDTFDESDPAKDVNSDDLVDFPVAVRSTLKAEDLYDFEALDDDDEIKTNKSQPNSVFNQMKGLPIEAIRNMKPSGQGFQYPINFEDGGVIVATPEPTPDHYSGRSSGSGSGQGAASASSRHASSPPDYRPASPDIDDVLGDIKIAEDGIYFIVDQIGNKLKKLSIKTTSFFVGGRVSDSYQGKPVVRIDSDRVMCPHFEIKYEAGVFYLRPIGPVTVSQIPVPKGEWRRLSARNASVMIDGEIEVIFNKR